MKHIALGTLAIAASLALALAARAEPEKVATTAPTASPTAREWTLPDLCAPPDIQVAGDYVFLTSSLRAADQSLHFTALVLNTRTGACKETRELLPAAHRDRVAAAVVAVAPDGKHALILARPMPQDGAATAPTTIPATLYMLDVGAEKAVAVKDFTQTTRPGAAAWKGNDRFVVLSLDTDLAVGRPVECDASGKAIGELPVYIFPLAATTDGQVMLAAASDTEGAHSFSLGALVNGCKLLLLGKDYKVCISLDSRLGGGRIPMLSPGGKFLAVAAGHQAPTSDPATAPARYQWRVVNANGEVAYKITDELDPLRVDDSGEFLAHVWYTTERTSDGWETTHGVSRIVRWNHKGEKTTLLDQVGSSAAVSGDTLYYLAQKPAAEGKTQYVLNATKLSDLK